MEEMLKLLLKGQEDIKGKLDHIEKRLDEVEEVVRMSAQDILDNQVEVVATQQTTDETIKHVQKDVWLLRKRVEKLEKASE